MSDSNQSPRLQRIARNLNFVCNKFRYDTFQKVNDKGADQTARMRRLVCTFNEACIGVLGIQDICHFTSRDIGYYPFYFQGYGILGSIFLLLPGILKTKEN